MSFLRNYDFYDAMFVSSCHQGTPPCKHANMCLFFVQLFYNSSVNSFKSFQQQKCNSIIDNKSTVHHYLQASKCLVHCCSDYQYALLTKRITFQLIASWRLIFLQGPEKVVSQPEKILIIVFLNTVVSWLRVIHI